MTHFAVSYTIVEFTDSKTTSLAQMLLNADKLHLKLATVWLDQFQVQRLGTHSAIGAIIATVLVRYFLILAACIGCSAERYAFRANSVLCYVRKSQTLLLDTPFQCHINRLELHSSSLCLLDPMPTSHLLYPHTF